MQGLVFIPLFVGYDHRERDRAHLQLRPRRAGPTEGTVPTRSGWGSVYAQGVAEEATTPRTWQPTRPSCASLQALYDAADDDSATGGPDPRRRIFPVVTTITADGSGRLPEAEVAEVAQRVVAGRMSSPDGPVADLRA